MICSGDNSLCTSTSSPLTIRSQPKTARCRGEEPQSLSVSWARQRQEEKSQSEEAGAKPTIVTTQKPAGGEMFEHDAITTATWASQGKFRPVSQGVRHSTPTYLRTDKPHRHDSRRSEGTFTWIMQHALTKEQREATLFVAAGCYFNFTLKLQTFSEGMIRHRHKVTGKAQSVLVINHCPPSPPSLDYLQYFCEQTKGFGRNMQPHLFAHTVDDKLKLCRLVTWRSDDWLIHLACPKSILSSSLGCFLDWFSTI